MLHTKKITITAQGRDFGKRFVVTEMSAWAWDEWQSRALFAISKGGGAVPDDFTEQGLAGLLAFGLQALTSVSFEEARPLMAELMACVGACPDDARPDFVRPGGVLESDFEEAKTIQFLRKEALELHLGFSIADEWLKYQAALSALRGISNTPNTPTSAQPLAA